MESVSRVSNAIIECTNTLTHVHEHCIYSSYVKVAYPT